MCEKHSFLMSTITILVIGIVSYLSIPYISLPQPQNWSCMLIQQDAANMKKQLCCTSIKAEENQERSFYVHGIEQKENLTSSKSNPESNRYASLALISNAGYLLDCGEYLQLIDYNKIQGPDLKLQELEPARQIITALKLQALSPINLEIKAEKQSIILLQTRGNDNIASIQVRKDERRLI